MRVIGGSVGGRRLFTPKGRDIRPTSDRVREALFSALGDLDGLAVADLFCGSGALGIEALSRGAASCLFVDVAGPSLTLTGRNLEALNLSGARILRGDSVKLLEAGRLQGRGPWDLVFLDPPYAKGMAQAALKALGEGAAIPPGGRVVAEVDKREPMEDAYGRLRQVRKRGYGDSVIYIFERVALPDDKGEDPGEDQGEDGGRAPYRLDSSGGDG